MDLKLQDVNEEDRGILSPCGILCIGCDTHVGEGVNTAKALVEIWDGWNMADVGPLLGLNLKGINTTLNTLKKYVNMSKGGNCPGCFKGGGPSQVCGIANCVKAKGFWTCAECEDYDVDAENHCPHINKDQNPITDKGSMMNIICKRYSGDTVNNIKKCREIGYNAFIEEAKEKVSNGWRTWQIISKENFFTEATKK